MAAATSKIFLDASTVAQTLEEPASNTLILDFSSNNTGTFVDASYGVRLTTGMPDKLVIDVSGFTIPAAFRIRCDVVDYNIISNNRTYTTNFFAQSDCSAVAGNIDVGNANEGKAIATMADRPFTFRTLDTGSGAAPVNGFRAVFKKAGVVKNGQHVNVYIDTSSTSTAANFAIAGSGVDLSFTQASTTAPYALVNGGPSGVDGTVGIPPFTASLTKNASNSANADYHVLSRSPFFAQGGEGIALKKATFKLTEYEQGDIGTEVFTTISAPTATEEPNADGFYKYTVKTGIVGGATKAYQVTCTRIEDDFGVAADIQQPTETNEAILIENKAAAITTSTYDISGASVAGGQAVVKFKLNNAPEGFTTIKRYTHYYLTKAQVSDICANRTGGVKGDTDFSVTFPLVKAKAESLGQVHIVDAADISYGKYDSLQETTIKNLATSDLSDNYGNYSIYTTASTLKDGEYVEGTGPSAVNFSTLGPIKKAGTQYTPDQGDVSYNGFYISGAPGAPSASAIIVGKDISAATALNSQAADASMINSLKIIYNDFQIPQNGSNYTKLSYAIIKSSEVQYAGSSDFTADGSFVSVSQAYDGTQSLEFLIIDVSGSAAGIGYTYNTSTSKWVTTSTAAARAAQPGVSYSIKYAFENAVGVGGKTAWLPFTPSTMPDVQDQLFSADPSNVLTANASHAFFGNTDATNNYSAKTLLSSDVDSAEVAARQGLVIDDKSIKFGWSFKSYNQIKKGLDASASLTGGSAIKGVRYVVQKSSATNLDKEAIRTYGAVPRDFNAVKSRPVRTSTNLSSLTVTHGKDASDAFTQLRMGVRYDISFSLYNDNGYNDISNMLVKEFAPMGSIVAPTNLRQGSTAPRMAAGSTTDCIVDICFNDISGVSEHGGHLITAYNVKIEQFVNGTPTTLMDYVADDAVSTGMAVDLSNSGLATTGKDRNRALSLTTSTGKALAGYPLKLSIKAVARAKALVGTTNNAEADNLLFNKNRAATVEGPASTVNLPGPTLSGTVHDEVRGLGVASGDESVIVSFSQPQNGAVAKDAPAAPQIRYYELFAYDICLNTSDVPLNQAHSRSYKKVDTNGPEYQDDNTYKATMSGLKNGGAYLVAVHTRWGYGANQAFDFTTSGIYSSIPGKGDLEVYAHEATDGTYKWYSNSDPNQQSAAIATNATPAPLPNAIAKLVVPCKVPTITYTAPNSLVIKNNGSALLDALLLQLSPTPSGATGNNAFDLDLTANSLMTDKRLNDANGQRTMSIEHTVKSTTLGTNWANEKNIVIAGNVKGVDHITIG